MKRTTTGLLVLGGAVILAAVPLVVTSWAPEAAETAEAAETPVAVPTTDAEHVAEAQAYEKEAAELTAKARRHASLAASYRARMSGGDKQTTSLRSLMKHCERLSKVYGEAAAEATEMARMHRDMARGE